MSHRITETEIELDAALPVVRIVRDFAAPPAAVLAAHTDPERFVRWVGPEGGITTIDHWEARTGGAWRYRLELDGEEHGFFGSFHEITPSRIVQTFAYEPFPEAVQLEFISFEDLGDGWTRRRSVSVSESMLARDELVANGLEEGVLGEHAKLERLLAAG